MNCPRCPTSVLEERERDGITIDVCRTCYGVWLDRGELERLIARGRDEYEELERGEDLRARPPQQFRDDRHDRRRDDRNSYGYREPYGHPPRKRKRWFEALGDILD